MKIVAEIGASHNGNLERALCTIRAAAAVGADAVKFQTWSPDKMDAGGRYIDSGTWSGWSLRDLYSNAWTPWDWFPAMIKEADDNGLEWWSTPFDVESLHFLEGLHCPRYKIASFELVDLPLIIDVAHTRKPIILSTGMATYDEINDAVMQIPRGVDITLLKCVSAYPALPGDYNLKTMKDMREQFGCNIGLSDHTKGTTVPVAATVLGASMIERHLTISNDDGLDDSFASTPEEFMEMVAAVRTAREVIGEVSYGPTKSEEASLALRRSLWIVKDIAAGERITTANVRTARPADGMEPGHMLWILGKQVSRDLKAGEPLRKEDVCI